MSKVEFNKAIREMQRKNRKAPMKRYLYTPMEEIANGIRYFGERKLINKQVTALCICPKCKEIWRVSLRSVRTSKVLSCGCDR